MTVFTVAAVLLFVVVAWAMVMQWHARRELRGARLAPLESRAARDAVRVAAERRR